MRDRGPFMWALVSIGRDLVRFQFRDPTAGTRTYGDFVRGTDWSASARDKGM